MNKDKSLNLDKLTDEQRSIIENQFNYLMYLDYLNRKLIGRRCYVQHEGERKRGTIIGVLESIKVTAEVILHRVELDKPTPLQKKWGWLGFEKVELIDEKL